MRRIGCKQLILYSSLIAFSLLFLCQCTAQRPKASSIASFRSETVAPSDITSVLKEASNNQVAWVGLSCDQLSNYYGFAGESLQDFSVFISDSDELSNEIAVFLPKDDDARRNVLEGISQHINKVTASFRNISETEYKKIQSRLIMELDGMVILAVTNDNRASYEILKEMGAQEITEKNAS